jgi:broad specificity phosphatase PhoE
MRSAGLVDRVWIVRHGQTRDNLYSSHRLLTLDEYNRLVRGADDREMTAEGRRQIAALVDVFRERGITTVFASPLPRAIASAEILADGLSAPIVTIPGFREFVPIAHEPLRRYRRPRPLRWWFLRSMTRQFLPLYDVEETAYAARGRVVRAWRELLRWRPPLAAGSEPAGRERLVVSHQGIILLLLSFLRFDRSWRVVRRDLANAGITEVERRRADILA